MVYQISSPDLSHLQKLPSLNLVEPQATGYSHFEGRDGEFFLYKRHRIPAL